MATKEFQGYNQYETDDQYLQDLAYKAKFAEEISNNMQVPKTLNFHDDDETSTSHHYKNQNVELTMKVPSRIVLNRTDSEGDREMLGESPDEHTFNSSAELTPKKMTLNLDQPDDASFAQPSRQIELKTPPRVLGVLDRLETGDTPAVISGQFNKITGLNTQMSVGQAAEEALKNQVFSQSALNELLSEEPATAIIRQQLQQINRRLKTENADRLKTEKFNQKLIYTALGVSGVALIGVLVALRRTSNQLSYY